MEAAMEADIKLAAVVLGSTCLYVSIVLGLNAVASLIDTFGSGDPALRFGRAPRRLRGRS